MQKSVRSQTHISGSLIVVLFLRAHAKNSPCPRKKSSRSMDKKIQQDIGEERNSSISHKYNQER